MGVPVIVLFRYNRSRDVDDLCHATNKNGYCNNYEQKQITKFSTRHYLTQ